MHWFEDNLAEIVIFEMGEQVEPLSLKVLRISGYLMIWSSYLNIYRALNPGFLRIYPPKIKINEKFVKIINHARMVRGGDYKKIWGAFLIIGAFLPGAYMPGAFMPGAFLPGAFLLVSLFVVTPFKLG